MIVRVNAVPRPILLLAAACCLPASCGETTRAQDCRAGVVFEPGNGGEPSTYWTCRGVPGPILVGVAKKDITPAVVEVMTVDVDGDKVWEPHDGDRFDDVDGDGEFDAVWIAGLDNPRPAAGVHDPIETRVLVLRAGGVTVAIATADVIGLFYDETERLREAVSDLNIDYVVVASSHNHEGPDTLGLWGTDEITSGVDPAYLELVRRRIEEAIREAYAGLRPARVRYGATTPGEHADKGVANVVSDSRDPVIINERLTTLTFENPADGSVIATLVDFAAHPEYSGDRVDLLSADYVYWLRRGVESGVREGATDLPGVGGTAIFVQGPLGSQIGPGRVVATGLDGVEHRGYSREKAAAVGTLLAVGALRAIRESTPPEETMTLGFVRSRFEVTIENFGYHAMLLADVFRRSAHGYDPTRPLERGNYPKTWTEISWLRLGRAQVLTFPGEPSPELLIGGYDGSHTPSIWPIVDETATNPPVLTRRPPGPYLFDRLRDLGAEYPMGWSTTNDMLGYLMPSYDYELHPAAPYIEEAPGDHYEETNSIGPNGWPTMEAEFEQVLAGTPGR